ncbi:uncharacterized protein [Antedon mediterranea]|uniref:uncharacterized protein n=1 Tax=Antedon mediterranea TaxID=105859 RepID=UPI003AF7DDA7
MDEIKRRRSVQKGAMTRVIKTIQQAMEESSPVEYLEILIVDMTEIWKKIQDLHVEIQMKIEDPEDAEQAAWIEEVQNRFNDVRRGVIKYKANVNPPVKVQEDERDPKEKRSTLQLKKMDLPRFEGNVRRYARFKEDFKTFVIPVTHPKQLSFALRQTLGQAPLKILGPVEDNIDLMWERLDERYGDKVKLVDTIVSELEQKREIKDGEDNKLVTYIDKVEASYHDLKRAGLEREISNSKVVGEIEKKLPPSVFGRWVRHMHEEANGVDKTDRFPELLKFGESQHETKNCRTFLNKSVDERLNILKENRACFCCLTAGHIIAKCKGKKQCDTDGCRRLHHKLLHQQTQNTEPIPTVSSLENSLQMKSDPCLLQLMKVRSGKNELNTLWDSCATASLITHDAAKRIKAKGRPVKISMTKVGGQTECIDSMKYKILLNDNMGNCVAVEAYGIPKITAKIGNQNLENLAKILNVYPEQVKRPTGEVDLLVGYEYAGYHPTKIKACGHLVLLKNQFGQCIGGSHPSIEWEEGAGILVNYVKTTSFDDFLTIESMGVNCQPKCGSCRCGKCPSGAQKYTLKEERELKLIEDNLLYEAGKWTARYPWIKDPNNLPDNKKVAVAKLAALEKRLMKDSAKKKIYEEQIADMLKRGVAREIKEMELQEYKGPIHYISHHAVEKPDSSSTPVRIVFNSSAAYKGHVLNDYWAKGPDLVNDLLAVLLRFREKPHALVGDIRKMYHSVAITQLDQHCHRFLWRDLNQNTLPKTYCVTAVNFGDRPSATIATVALRKTAKAGKLSTPEAAETVLNNVYVDDILECEESAKKARQRAEEREKLIQPGNFAIKHWIFSGREKLEETWNPKEEKVLGISWKPGDDVLAFTDNVRTFKEIPEVLTKRICLSKINSVYDPLGLITPITVRAKILLRKLWGAKLEWDEAINMSERAEWIDLFEDLSTTSSVEFRRCVKPLDAKPGILPSLIMFSDASEKALGAVAYVRYEQWDGQFSSKIVASKSRVAPIEIISVVRLELSAAVMSKRLAQYIINETRIMFDQVFYVVDSEIVQAMVQKQSYGFKTFAATRIGEIQQDTEPQDWWWCRGEVNIADAITRGMNPSQIGPNSEWQRGPEFLRQPVENWPIEQSCNIKTLPERVKIVMAVNIEEEDSLADRIIRRQSKYQKLLRVTARVLKVYEKRRLKSILEEIEVKDTKGAEHFWIKESQKIMINLLSKDKTKFDKTYARLGPKIREDGVIVVGERISRNVHFSYNKQEVPLLPYDNAFTKLYAKEIHSKGHLGVQSIVAKIRSKYWIIDVQRMVKSIKYHCVTCRRFEKNTAAQKMGPLPITRLKPSPPWMYIGVDLFGPFTTRGEVNKRARGKAYGVVFDCFVTRAVYIDIATDYSTDAFLQVFRKFVSLRGYPKEVYSDAGTQLSAAAKQLKSFGVNHGTTWKFSTPDAPWQNGVTESLIRGIKKALSHAIGGQVLAFSELQTVMFEVANLTNERPIGKHPTDPQDGSYLSPNDLLLGRSTGKVPDEPWSDNVSIKDRLKFIQCLVNGFWKKWTRDYFPSLIIRQKWHTIRRDVKKGDVVLIQDSNAVRGKWRLGRVTETYQSTDDRVRNAEVRVHTENGLVTTLKRAVQRLVVILPIEEQ